MTDSNVEEKRIIINTFPVAECCKTPLLGDGGTMAEEKKLLKVTIDNISIEVEPGTTILMAARKIGGDIVPPAMCYYSKLKNTGGYCRTCLVRVAAGSTADPRPMPKLVASCRTNVM